MGSTLAINGIRFVLLLIFQVLVFNKINLFGYINPYPYVIYILLFPATGNKKILLVTSFLLGYWIDLTLDSGGAHALSSVVIAYNRKKLFNLFFGATYENQTLDLKKAYSVNMYKYILFFVLIHHLMLYLVSIFSFSHIVDILGRTITSSFFTLLLVILLLLYYKPKR